MALNCGIVGLPNVGKTTIFSALTATPAETANYQFSTIKPNLGVIQVPDSRLAKLSELFKPQRTIPASIEFVDISGLVKGSSRGEGLGNQFLSHIREVGVIAHVVRCFDDPDIIHVSDRIDPASDIDTINVELALADLETLQKRRDRAERALRVQGKAEQRAAEAVLHILSRLEAALEQGKPARTVELTEEEQEAVYDCHFITMKPLLYVCNVNEKGLTDNPYVDTVLRIAAEEGTEGVVICGKFEAELTGIPDEAERLAFLADLGMAESGLGALVHAAYRLLGLSTFFTVGPDECRAWTIHNGATAPKAAGIIHSDLERGFIKAEVYSFEDMQLYGSESRIKEAGKYRLEGKDYLVKDGDVLFIKFNV